MVNNIRICPDGHIIPDSDCLGRTGEHNATILQFSFFDKLNGEDMSDFEKYLVAELPEGNFPLAIDGDFLVPNILTCNTELPMFVEIRKGESVLFRSCPHIFTFADTGGNSENDAIGMAMDSAREERRQELSAILAMATGEPQDGKTWDELKKIVKDTSLLPLLDGLWEFFEEYHFVFIPDPPEGGEVIPDEGDDFIDLLTEDEKSTNGGGE